MSEFVRLLCDITTRFAQLKGQKVAKSKRGLKQMRVAMTIEDDQNFFFFLQTCGIFILLMSEKNKPFEETFKTQGE